MSIKLTDTQFAMLSDAARREDRCLVALPSLKGGARLKVANKLISAGFVTQIEAKVRAPIWRRDNEMGKAYTLKLTAEGAKAIGLDEDVEAPDSHGESSALENHDPADISSKMEATAALEPREPAAGGPSAPRSGSKLAQVIDLLRQDGGATVDELIGATGWLAHTTRAALTGLRKRGYAVEINRKDKDRGSFYRIRAEDRRCRPRSERSANQLPVFGVAGRAPLETAGTPSRLMSRRSPLRGVGAGSVRSTPRPGSVAQLDETISCLLDLDASKLCLQWRNHLGGTPPAHLPRWLLLRILAYRLQAAAFGGLDKETLRILVSREARGSTLHLSVVLKRGCQRPAMEQIYYPAHCSRANGTASSNT